MDDLRAHERNLEEEWISKYRAALQAVPNRETWDARLYRIAYKAGGKFATRVQEFKTKFASHRVVARWMDLLVSSSAASQRSQQRLAVTRPVQAYAQKRHAVALHGRRAKKAG